MRDTNSQIVFLKYDFNISSEKEMIELGKAFASVGRPFSVGLQGTCNSGKTHFSQGLISKFISVDIEDLGKCVFERVTEGGEHILHYDYLFELVQGRKCEAESSLRGQGVVIVEHADSSGLEFDCWVNIDVNKDKTRSVSVEIPRIRSYDSGVECFLAQSKKFAIA